MYTYNKGILSIRQIDVPKLDINIMDDLQQSYRKYLEVTVKEDMQFLVDELKHLSGLETLEVVVTVKALQAQTYRKTLVKNGTYYYPVICDFKLHGASVGAPREVLRVPYMDDYGKINVDGSSKVVLAIQRAAEDISYTLKQNLFNIAMPYANLRIISSRKSIKVRYGKRKIDINRIIMAMLHSAGDSTKLSDIFTNTHLITALGSTDNVIYRYVYASLRNETDLLDKLASTQYKLGMTRESINEQCQLDRGVGYILSRDVLNYPAGTQVTQDMVKEMKKNRVNIYHIQNFEVPEGYILAEQSPLIFTMIPKGFKNCNMLRERFPQYADYATIPEDIYLEYETAVIIPNNTALTRDVIEFLINAGYTKLTVTAGVSKKPIVFSFEREIVGNYTARLKELTTNIPDGRSADEWVYFYNNPDLERVPNENLNCHDFIAIVSIIGQIMLTGKSPLLDRDTSFLKKVLLVNEVFSENLRRAITEYVRRNKSYISTAIQSASAYNPFQKLTFTWIAKMNQERVLAPADTLNIAAEVSQVNHINTIIQSSSQVQDEQRHLAMPFFGRVCPYETPAGKKLGIVNTKSIGCRIVDGLPKAPYYRIIQSSSGLKISSRVEWLSVKEELGKKFVDRLSLRLNSDGTIIDQPVLARTPNPDDTEDPFIFQNIRTSDLNNGYVTAYPEQFLSPTAALIPFACSDDPVRISYGLSQLRQAIYLVFSQSSRVVTPMYKDIFTYSDTTKYRSQVRGTIVEMDNMHCVIRDNANMESVIYMQGSGHMGRLDATLEFNKKVGDRVDIGDIIAEAHKYPQPFVVRAPYDARVTEIGDEYIQLSRNINSNSSFQNLEDMDKISISNSRIMGNSVVLLNLQVSVGDVVRKGQILADTCASRDGIYTPSRAPLVCYMSNGYNYEDGVCATESAAIEYTSINTHAIEVTVSKRTYPYARAHMDSGFKYCGPNDPVGKIKCHKGVMSKEGYTRTVKANIKQHGIPFEYAKIEDTPTSHKYRFHVLGFNKLHEGDKMAGRHGNKGVVSRVLKDSEAPQLKNGRTVRFVLNPCGVPSRMNLGQIWEAHLTLAAEVLQCFFDVEAFNGASPEDVEYLLRYAWTLANTPAIGDNVTHTYNKAVFDSIASAFSELPKQFHEDVWANIENVIDWRGVFNPDGSAELYDPETDTYFDGNVTIGFPQYNKQEQEADEKINVRSGLLDEQYASINGQPQKSENSAKGQRMAEMELMALAAMGTSSFIDEIINEKSDNGGRRINNHLKQLGIDPLVPEHSCYSRAVENLSYMLEAVGVKMELPPEILDTSKRVSGSKMTINVPKLLHEETQFQLNPGSRTEYETHDSMSDIED